MADQRPYDLVAQEYYDAVRHPTCANFREASKQIISTFLNECATKQKQIEVGVGASVLAEILVERGDTLEDTFLVDSSLEMLRYSNDYQWHGAALILGDAMNLPFKNDAADLLVSSLGDPFNTKEFWIEVNRVLRSGGRAIFTTPAHDWAAWFRANSNSDKNSAQFELRSGVRVSTPSHIYTKREMEERLFRVGLGLRRYLLVRTNELATVLSNKLVRENAVSSPVVEGYLVDKL